MITDEMMMIVTRVMVRWEEKAREQRKRDELWRTMWHSISPVMRLI
jgi:hypothetical protein